MLDMLSSVTTIINPIPVNIVGQIDVEFTPIDDKGVLHNPDAHNVSPTAPHTTILLTQTIMQS